MTEISVKPTITRGRWTAPSVMPSWTQCNSTGDPNASPFTGQQLPDQINMADYPYAQYWENVQDEHERMMAEGARDAMETQAQAEDASGVPLPDRPGVAVPNAGKPKVNVRIVFDQQCARIEKGFVPLGLISLDGTQFKFIMPPGHMGDQIGKRVFAIPVMIRSAAWERYSRMYEVYLGLTKVLPVPLHTSPLALLMVRESSEAMRYKDAISTLHGLHVLRHAMHEMDTEDQEHKAKCWNFYSTLEGYVSERFFAELDRLAEEEQAVSPVSREVAESVARKFGQAASHFALDMVHAIEWCCMDILKLPYEWRHLFMTPNEFPSGETLYKVAFDQMRVQTVRYIIDRNRIFCGLYADEQDAKTGVMKRVYKGIDPNCWAPMKVENPPLADRPYLLGTWTRETDPALASWCLFGIFNGWIDLHTLREYMRMLEVDSRPETAARVKAARAAKLYNPPPPDATEGTGAEGVPNTDGPAGGAADEAVAMDTGADDDGESTVGAGPDLDMDMGMATDGT
jgi:hypothetical protein